MKKWIALMLFFLLATMSVTAAAEVDFSSYTEAELRELRAQLDSAILGHCRDEGNGQAVCDAFIQYMQELGHTLEYNPELEDEEGIFFYMLDGNQKVTFTVYSGYSISLERGFAANNEAYARDCMVALAMAVAQFEGVEIFSNEISKAMHNCEFDMPDGFYKDNITILWRTRKYGYHWFMTNNDGTTLIFVY